MASMTTMSPPFSAMRSGLPARVAELPFSSAKVDWPAWSVVQIKANKTNFLACPMERVLSGVNNDYRQVM